MKFAFGIWLVLAAIMQAAGLEFDSMSKEVHAPVDAATVTADFKFTNKGSKPVTITKSDPGCSCLSVQISGGKLKYAPGESGVVRATFDMGNFSGEVDKVIALWLDKDPPDKPSTKLTVRVHIPVLISLEPKTLAWVIGGKADSKTIKIRMADGEKIKVTGVTSSSPTFKYEVKTVEEGREYDLVVTPTAVDAPAIGVLRVETDCKFEKHKTQQGFGVVRKATPAQAAAAP